MSDYTQEQINEMRKRLPFKAVVSDQSEKVISVILDDGRCANNEDIWGYFIEVTEPEYVPFTAETIKPFRDEWVNYCGIDRKIVMIEKNECKLGHSAYSFKYLLENGATFADSGKPFGKEVK